MALVTSLICVDEVKFKEVLSPWRPHRFKKCNEECKTQELYMNFIRFLNKVSPQTLDYLLEKVKTLDIHNQVQLEGIIGLIYEKAIREPDLSSLYAAICNKLSKLKVPADNTLDQFVNFRGLIICMCQSQFLASKLDDQLMKLEMEVSECTDPVKNRKLRLLLEELIRRAKRRNIGNVRFIGELYKLKMLSVKIMVFCMNHLIHKPNEENLECLCTLLTTIGEKVETEVKDKLDSVFNEMQIIANHKNNKISSHIRFMIQDVIKLRRTKWMNSKLVSPSWDHKFVAKTDLPRLATNNFKDEGKNTNRGLTNLQRRSATDKAIFTLARHSNWRSRGTSGSPSTSLADAPVLPMWQKPLPEFNKQFMKEVIIGLCLMHADVDEFVSEFKILFPPQYHAGVVSEIFNVACERSAKDLGMIAKSLLHAVSTNTITPDNFLLGLAKSLEYVPDLYLDIPLLHEYLAKIVVPQIEKQYITLAQVHILSESIISYKHGHLLRAILRDLRDSMGDDFVQIKWKESGLQLTEWIDEDQVPSWIVENKLEFLEGDIKIGEQTRKILTPAETQKKLLKLLNSDENCDLIKAWVQDNPGMSSKEELSMKSLIQAYITLAQVHILSESIISYKHGHLLRAILRDLRDSMGDDFVQIKWKESGLQLTEWIDEDQVPSWIVENKLEFLEGDIKIGEQTRKILTPAETQKKLLKLLNSDENCDLIKAWVQDNPGMSSKEELSMKSLIQAVCEYALFGSEDVSPYVKHVTEDS